MTAGRMDFVMDQGEDWTAQLVWADFFGNPITVIDPMRMDIKALSGTVVHSLIYVTGLPPDEIPPITYNSEAGLIQLHIPADASNLIPGGIYSYDLWVNVNDGDAFTGNQKTPLIRGVFEVRSRITQGI